jgi:hypothetical protein
MGTEEPNPKIRPDTPDPETTPPGRRRLLALVHAAPVELRTRGLAGGLGLGAGFQVGPDLGYAAV